ncbi:MAG: MBL fold metallo-hydrolase [Lachnospiraceae bacterium]|nr:MBL fold metallo-hydrolase [Lachnospiraceae bacterium]
MVFQGKEIELYINEVRPGIYLLDEGHMATGYLVVGETSALLIDTMCGLTDLGQAVRNLTDKPVKVINTHGHPDHIYGNIYFDEAYINPADLELAHMFMKEPLFVQMCEQFGAKMPPFRDILPGEVIDLGGRTLTLYGLPGHTPGGLLLLLKEDRILFTGDSINHHLWMQVPGALPMREFLNNLDNIMFLENEADVILHGHARDFDDISLLRCVRQGAEEICEGKTGDDKPYEWSGGTGLQHAFKCDPDKHYQQEDHVICYPSN